MNAPAASRSTRSPMGMLFALLRGAPRLKQMVVTSVLMSLTEGAGLLLLIPILASIDNRGSTVRHIVDRSGLSNGEAVLLTLAAGVVIVVARALISRAANYEQRVLEFHIVDDLRRRIFVAAGRAEWRWLSAQRTADHISVMSTQIGRLGAGLFSATQIVAVLVSIVTYLAVILLISWQTALVAVGGGLLVGLLLMGQRARTTRLGREIGPLMREVHRIAQDGLTEIRLNRLLYRQERAEAELDASVEQLRTFQFGHASSIGYTMALGQIITATLGVALIGFGHLMMGLSIAQLLPLLFAVVRLGPMIGRIQDSWNHWMHAAPAAEAILELIDELEAAAEPDFDPAAPRFTLEQAIRLDGVTLFHPGRERPAVDSVSLTIPARTTTAVIGPSGAGKSTLADLLMGMLEPDRGSIAVDGIAITGAERLRWRRSVGYVEQQAALLNATVRENLLAAAPGTDEPAMWAALTAASAGFVAALPARLDTQIGDNGVRLSGGERQRLALARTLLTAPELLILDEATSALDPDNQAAIADAIAALHGRMTIVTISHGGFMLDRADRIVRVEAGRVSELPVTA